MDSGNSKGKHNISSLLKEMAKTSMTSGLRKHPKSLHLSLSTKLVSKGMRRKF